MTGSDVLLSEMTALTYEGIYQATTLTKNSMGCDSPGMDLLPATPEPYFLMQTSNVFGQQKLDLISCMDAEDCRTKASKLGTMTLVTYEYSASLTRQAGPDDLLGFAAWTGTERDGVCVERTYDDTVLARTGDSVRVETQTLSLADKPPEDGFCVVEPDKSKAEAAGAPCIELLVIEGKRVSAL